MSILTRYILRAHAGPLIFAFTALTGLLFLNTVAQRLENLVGKGLGWDVMLDFVLLSLPHTVALTLPMSVLVAVLYAFSDLTANSEITAMAAGGVRPSRILMPVVVAGAFFSVGMFYFNDHVLPEANQDLTILMADLANKSPTFQLSEQVVNEIRTQNGSSRFYLRAARIDSRTNELYDVAIHDVSAESTQRTTYADSGSMAFNALGTDLYLTLYDGVVLEADSEDPGAFQRLRFEQQVVPIRGVGDVLERGTGGRQRGEREMTIAMLADTASARDSARAEALRQIEERSRNAVTVALGLAGEGGDLGGGADGKGRTGSRSFVDGTREALGRGPAGGGALPRDDALTRETMADVRTNRSRAETLRNRAAAYRVEIHKKFSIAFACLVFVLVGAPIAVRFPRGGVGMTIAVSVSVFAIYYAGLIGGETLADRGYVDPFVAMWTTNLIFLGAGVFMSFRMDRWVATSRGGGWSDLLHTLKKTFRRSSRLAAEAGGG